MPYIVIDLAAKSGFEPGACMARLQCKRNACEDRTLGNFFLLKVPHQGAILAKDLKSVESHGLLFAAGVEPATDCSKYNCSTK